MATPRETIKEAYDNLASLRAPTTPGGNKFMIENAETTVSAYIARKTVDAVIGRQSEPTVTANRQRIDANTAAIASNAASIAALPRYTTRPAGTGAIPFPHGAKMVQVYDQSGNLRTAVAVQITPDEISLTGAFAGTDEVRILY